jgi:putative transposase
MPSGLKRYYGNGDLHFVTFSCYQRLPLLGTKCARNVFVDELEKVRNEMGFRLIGYVVMPEHVHLLMSEPRIGTPSTVLQKLKLRVSLRMRKRREVGDAEHLPLPIEESEVPPKAFWQPRFYDFNVNTIGKRKEKLDYMHANPVVRGLVEHPRNWPWSSWSSYMKDEAGLISIDSEARRDRGIRRPQDPGKKSNLGHPTDVSRKLNRCPKNPSACSKVMSLV